MVRGGGRGYRGGGRGGSYRGGSGSGGYRGSSNRNSSFNSSGGSYGGSRNYGGGSSYNSYDSHSKDRMSSRHSDRHDDRKRSYRAASRDRSADRKRSRHEDSRLSSSYSSYRRNESSRSRQTPPPPTRPSSSSAYRHRDDSSHRHSGPNDMGPPKSVAPRSSRPLPRSRGAGTGRVRGSTRNIRLGRRRESTDMMIMRKKLLLARQRDRARRIKIAKLTSSLRKRRDVPRKPIRKVRSDKKDGDSSKNDEDDDDKKKPKEEDEDDDKNDDEEKGEETEDKSDLKKAKEIKKDGESGDESDGEKDDETEKKDGDKSKSSPRIRKTTKKSFIKLTCIHCRMKCLTFKDYSNHLFSRTHKIAMRRLALRQKDQLAHMRLQQRNAQRDIESSSKEETEGCAPLFCLLCRLNYRQPKEKHQSSEAHKNMKKFLMPYCSTCHIAFKSPMVYESHRCSLEHIKYKARNETQNSDSSDGEKEVDLKNFMTVDSVGEIDGHHLEDEDEDQIDLAEDSVERVNVGIDHVKKKEVFYCEICRYYFPFKEDEEGTLKKHCATRSHYKSFLRHKKDQIIREEAERQRLKKEAKEKKEAIEKEAENKDKTNDTMETEEGGEDKLWEDVDKDLGDLLREVGPDGQEDDEEDGSVLNINIERFDRFKNSDKLKKEVNGKDNGEEKEEEEEEDEEEEEEEAVDEPETAPPPPPPPAKAKKEPVKKEAAKKEVVKKEAPKKEVVKKEVVKKEVVKKEVVKKEVVKKEVVKKEKDVEVKSTPKEEKVEAK